MMEDDDAWIPCEACDTLVRFCDFDVHMRECVNMPMPMPMPQLSELMSLPPLFVVMHHGHGVAAAAAAAAAHGVAAPAQPGDEEEVEGDAPPVWSIILQAAASVASSNNTYDINTLLAESMGGDVDTPVADPDKVLRAATMTKVEEDSKCPICYEDLVGEAEKGVAIVETVPCGHAFCSPCIRTWLSRKSRCPVCMTELRSIISR